MSLLRANTVASILAITAVACSRTVASDAVTPDDRLTYQPFAASYVGAAHRIVEQEFNGQTVTTEAGMHFFMRTELVRAGDKLGATIVLDSVVWVQGPSSGMLHARLDSARGATFTAVVAPNGHTTEWGGGETSGSVAMQLAEEFFSNLLPVTPAEGLADGVAWSDTVQTTANIGGVEDALLEAVRQHHAAGWTDYHDERALEIQTESRYTFSGAGSQVGQPFTIEGTGSRRARQFVAADGRYLGALSVDTLQAQAALSDAGITIPVRQIRTDTLTQIPR
jgi:hypothetical protein